MTPMTDTQIRAGIDVLRTARAEIDRLRAIVAGVESLTRDTDGDTLNPDEEIPVGEVLRFLHDPDAQV